MERHHSNSTIVRYLLPHWTDFIGQDAEQYLVPLEDSSTTESVNNGSDAEGRFLIHKDSAISDPLMQPVPVNESMNVVALVLKKVLPARGLPAVQTTIRFRTARNGAKLTNGTGTTGFRYHREDLRPFPFAIISNMYLGTYEPEA